MVMLQGCKGITGSGPCKASPLRGEKYCFWHHPDHQGEAEQARKLGGQRRKREGALQGAYDLEGLDSVPACVGCLSSRSLTRSTSRTPWAEAASSSRSPRRAPGYLRPASRSSAWPTSRRRSARGLLTPRPGEGGTGDEACHLRLPVLQGSLPGGWGTVFQYS